VEDILQNLKIGQLLSLKMNFLGNHVDLKVQFIGLSLYVCRTYNKWGELCEKSCHWEVLRKVWIV
jgi:hypothetical protein